MSRRLTHLVFAAGLSTALFACNGSVPDVPEEATCTDGVRNGSETDIDCGGTCDVCDVGAGCVTGADCVDGVCDGGACQAAACDDGVLNGIETDIDCGGGECDLCDTGATCASATDCLDGVCESGECLAPTCNDGVRNGTETDLDCGGSACDECARGSECIESSDCADSVCFEGTCERVLFIRGTATTEDSAVEVFAEQSLVRVDFASAPTVTNFDGAPLELPVSDGKFVTSGISDTLGQASVNVAGVELTGGTGRSYYQSIAPTYYGVVIGVKDADSANTSYNAMVVQRLEGKEVEIRIIDQSK